MEGHVMRDFASVVTAAVVGGVVGVDVVVELHSRFVAVVLVSTLDFLLDFAR